MGPHLVAFVRVVFVLAAAVHLFLSIAAFYNNVGITLAIKSPAAITETLSLIIASLAPSGAAMILIAWLHRAGKKIIPIHTVAIFLTICYLISSILLSYRLKTGLAADPFLLWYHFHDAVRTIGVLSRGHAFLFGIIITLLFSYYLGLIDLFRLTARATRSGQTPAFTRVPNFVTAGLLVALVSTQFFAANGVGSLLLEFRQPRSEAKTLYVQYFEDSVNRNTSQNVPQSTIDRPQNLFFIHLESLNAQLVNSTITPRLVDIAHNNGVFFPQIQASSVFTILAVESILCSVLPTLGENLAQSESLFGRLVCLPRIMRQLGYRTIYFQNFANLDFNNMGPFLQAIGFEELHGGDLIKPDDKLLTWGLPEEEFYARVFAYLNKFKNERIFAYILIGATNHYPFYGKETQNAYPHLIKRLPFNNPVTIKERLANTTFLQDLFFGRMYDNLFVPAYIENSHMIVFGDHSWPIEVHQGNNHNLNGAFQENFVSSMAILPAKNSVRGSLYALGKKVSSLYSQIDILPTVLEMYGLKTFNFYGNSLYSELVQKDQAGPRNSCIISAQPFSGGAIALIHYPMKYIYDLKNGTVTIYHLELDPNEKTPIEVVTLDSVRMNTLNRCLDALRDKQSLHTIQIH